MNTVKRLRNSNSQPLPKKPFRFWINPAFLVTVLLGALIGTYLDLYYVGKGLYSFPARPFPDIFTIHVGFTLIGSPLMLYVFLLICQKLNRMGKSVAVLFVASIMAIFEKISEGFGLFSHAPTWNHMNSLIGYTVYLALMLVVYVKLDTKKPDS